MERKLCTILALDVVGFSKMMAEDEDQTFRLLNRRREFIDASISDHGGSIFNTAGDSVLAEFTSPVRAVECAVQIQNKSMAINAENDEKDRMRYRVGINIGDVMVSDKNLKKQIKKIVNLPTQVNIKEVRKPDLDATILAESVAQQLERRVQFRRAMKRAVQSALRQSAKGVRVEISGRLNGAEIARTEWYREGRVPLHTLRADVDYGTAEALTTYGIIGIKVWVYKGEIIGDPIKEGVSS